VAKDEEAIFDEDTVPGDRLNFLYSSSTVTKGRALGIVSTTGMQIEIGSIAAALRKRESKVRSVQHGADDTTHTRRYAES